MKERNQFRIYFFGNCNFFIITSSIYIQNYANHVKHFFLQQLKKTNVHIYEFKKAFEFLLENRNLIVFIQHYWKYNYYIDEKELIHLEDCQITSIIIESGNRPLQSEFYIHFNETKKDWEGMFVSMSFYTFQTIGKGVIIDLDFFEPVYLNKFLVI